MKTHRIAIASFVGAVVLTGALAAWAEQASRSNQSSQTDQNSQNSATSDSRSGSADTNQSIGKLDDKTRGATIRASKLIGQNLKNSNGDSVGEIKDLVIDSSGKVRYAAVTYGGFLGVGSKLFAVPFEAFHVRQNPNDRNDRGDYVLTLDVTKSQLDGAQGFDNNRWPDFANATFTQELDRRYNVHRSQTNSQAERSQNRNQSR